MAGLFESAFEFLFKYRPLVFERGRLAFVTPWPTWVLVLALAIAVGLTFYTYNRAAARNRRDAVVLATLRVLALALLLFSLSRPTLLIPTVVPQRNFLGILIDDSRSMQMDDLSELSGSGARTDLAQAMDLARRELAAVPLAGLILVTDGADNSESSLTEALLSLKANSVPVYAVGLGQERFARDIELSRVEAPRSALLGSTLVVDAVLEHVGFARETVEVQVEDDGRIVASEEVKFPGDGESATVRVQFTASESGVRNYRFRVPPQPGEQVDQNNEQAALIVPDRGGG
jgi:hypothetical protein